RSNIRGDVTAMAPAGNDGHSQSRPHEAHYRRELSNGHRVLKGYGAGCNTLKGLPQLGAAARLPEPYEYILLKAPAKAQPFASWDLGRNGSSPRRALRYLVRGSSDRP